MDKYTDEQIFWIKSIYIIFIIIWIIIVAVLKIYSDVASIVLFIPPILFIIAFFNVEYVDCGCANDILQTTFIFVGIIFALPLLKWLSKEQNVNFKKVSTVILFAVLLLILSYLHIFISPQANIIWKYCRSCLEVMSITLFVYAISLYFLDSASIT